MPWRFHHDIGYHYRSEKPSGADRGFKINGIPRQSLLPLGKACKEAIGVEPAQKPFDFIAVGFHVLKGKYRGKFLTGGID